MPNDSQERMKTYGWARQHGLNDPYDFAIQYEEYWGDKERLAELARAWERQHLLERRRRLEEDAEELRRRIELVDNGLERIEGYVYD